MPSSSIFSPSPSFGSHSSNKLAEIAARVVEELGDEAEYEVDDTFGFVTEDASVNSHQEKQLGLRDEDEDNGFDFTFACREPDSSPVSADEIFDNGRIRPLFPIVKSGFATAETAIESSLSPTPSNPSSIRLPLRKLLSEDRDPPSCSSSEADDLDGIPTGTYCVWTPKSAPEDSPERCKKSNSTGSSKRWKFRNLLHRSNSDGKETFVFLSPSNSKKRYEKSNAVGSKDGVKALEEGSYRGGGSRKEGDRRRSFLPYKPDLVGFLANVNGSGKNLHPF